MSRQGIVLGGIVGALALGVGTTAAFAAVPIPGADGKIRACVKYEDINKYEQMRWITKTACPKGEKLIAWNAKGPKGDKGATGATGPAGADGNDGAPGVNEAYSGAETNIGFGLSASANTILTVTVPEGSYIVTGTTELENFYDDPHQVTCSINNSIFTKRDVMVDPDDSDVMTVIGNITTAADGKIKLICNGYVDNVGEADNPHIVAIRIN